MKSRSGTWSYILKRFENVLVIGDLYISLEHNNAKKFCENYYLKSLIKVPANQKQPSDMFCEKGVLTPKTTGMERVGQFDLFWFFLKCIFFREGEPCFFVTFNIVKSHIFPENFIEILPVAQKV